MGIRAAAVWAFLWLGIGFFAVFPASLAAAVQLAQMGDRTFFITVIGLLVLFTLVFEHAGRLDRLQRQSGRIVQEAALLKAAQQNDLPRQSVNLGEEETGDAAKKDQGPDNRVPSTK